MGNLSLTLACCRTDRTEAIFAGEIRPQGIDLVCLDLWPHETFQRMAHFQEFDVAEMSLSSFLIAKDRGEPDLIGIPVYLSRAFRLYSTYIRKDAGIASAQDLRGKRVGVPEYQQTNALWQRGILQDFYGVRPEEMLWVQAGLQDPGREERLPIELPPGIRLQHVGDRSLNQMIAAGEIDAMISPRAPLVGGRPIPNTGRLFPNYKAEEQHYFQTTGIFPIIHVVAMGGELYRKYPWAAAHLYRMFESARQLWLSELRAKGSQRMGMPWVNEAIDETFAVMGEDWWSYGLDATNHRVLATVAGYSHTQGLTQRRLTPEELFAPNSYEEVHQ